MNQIRKKAAALKYNPKRQTSPRVTASGKGFIADSIIKKAKKNSVPIVEDATLVELLAELNINETIPEELYEAVAEVFAYIYRIDQNMDYSKKREN